MYLHYIHSALAYHCSSMQILTKLFSSINATDPKEELGVFYYLLYFIELIYIIIKNIIYQLIEKKSFLKCLIIM
jgi:hypothetical protein